MDDEKDTITLTLPVYDTTPDLSAITTTITIDCNSWGNSCMASSTCYPNSYSTITGTSPSINWSTINTGSSYSYYNNASNVILNNDGITMKEGTDIKLGDRSLLDMITSIENRLAILHPNPELENKWDELKELRNRYVELEKELIEKEKMWDILKKT